MQNTVVIDFSPENAVRYADGYAIVAIDVVRATTTAITALAAGYRCFPVATVEAALELAGGLDNPLLVGELNGEMPSGFDLNNSPVRLLARADVERPVIMLSSSGTRLIHAAAKCEAVYLACLRNYASVAGYLAGNYSKIAVIGAGSRGEFREEDQMCCAWVAERLLNAGYLPENATTADLIQRWSQAPLHAWTVSKSAAYLRSSGQLEDLEFILTNVADLTASFAMRDGEVIMGGVISNGAALEQTVQDAY